MLIQGDPTLARIVLVSLLESESQFFIKFEGGKEARVAFNKGDWKIAEKGGHWIQVGDAPQVQDSDDKLLHALMEQRLEANEAKLYSNSESCTCFHTVLFRTVPANAMADVIGIWIGTLDKITEINVTQCGRNGWFNDFND